MSNQIRKINVSANEEKCPADALMYDFRKNIKNVGAKYERHIEISNSSIEYWKKQADDFSENDNSITFEWDELVEKQLPPLKIKVQKTIGGYILVYLKEFGEDKLLIQGKQRKGKNSNGMLFLDKEIKDEEIKEGRRL